MSKIDFSDVGKTALLVAHFRAYTGDPITEMIAKESNARETAKTFFDSAGDMQRATAWLPTMLEIRTRGLTELLKGRVAKGTRAIVEIGGGVAVERALEISENPEVHYALTDYNHGLVSLQGEIVKKVATPRGNLFYMCIDALNESENHAVGSLIGNPYDKVMEGVLAYLPKESQRAFWKRSGSIMSQGSAILTTDTLTKEGMTKLLADKPERFDLMKKLMGISDCQVLSNMCDTREELLTMARDAGFDAHYEPLLNGSAYKIRSPDIVYEREGIRPSPDDIANCMKRQALVAIKR